MRTYHHVLTVLTDDEQTFIDLTEQIRAIVCASRVRTGVVNVQSQHTTAGIAVNEAEPLLLEDLGAHLARLAPANHTYRHDDFQVRTVNLTPNERPNGHSHCRALLLRTSECINIIDGELQLGRWQRIFLVELDPKRERHVSVLVMGDPSAVSRVAALPQKTSPVKRRAFEWMD